MSNGQQLCPWSLSKGCESYKHVWITARSSLSQSPMDYWQKSYALDKQIPLYGQINIPNPPLWQLYQTLVSRLDNNIILYDEYQRCSETPLNLVNNSCNQFILFVHNRQPITNWDFFAFAFFQSWFYICVIRELTLSLNLCH